MNEEQLAAVFAPVGPVRVVAGPGSGKTKVLTNRAAHLVLDQGVKPWNILVSRARESVPVGNLPESHIFRNVAQGLLFKVDCL